ncbi:hypothetical protein [Massilia sp. LjRoot122]|uniref:hypothetical protein n=1 Tax=Massilia sp. LjRoot122 TaxID=3342257 RepID=UPI003ECCCA88
MEDHQQFTFAEDFKSFIAVACRFFAGIMLLASILLFIGWIWSAVQVPPVAAIDRAPNVPWYGPPTYFIYSVVLYFFPTVLRWLDQRKAAK